MSAIAFAATFALFVAVALLMFESLKSFVIEYGTWQVEGSSIGASESKSQKARAVALRSILVSSSQCSVSSLFEREVVWSEQSRYVCHFISPLMDHFLIIGFGAIVFGSICCRISVSQQQDPPSPIRAPRVSDGSPGARYRNPRPVLRRGRGTLA